MKKMLVVSVMALVAFMLSGCAFKKYCFISPGLSEIKTDTQWMGVAVGTLVAQRPPHRSVLEELPHAALASGDDVR